MTRKAVYQTKGEENRQTGLEMLFGEASRFVMYLTLQRGYSKPISKECIINDDGVLAVSDADKNIV